MKIALVHDYLREYGGAERVVEAMHEIWPEAPLYTAFVDWKSLGEHRERFRGWDIRTAPISLIPGIRRIPGIVQAQDWLIRKFHSPLRFLAPKVWESFDFTGYDIVITSSGWFICRGVKAGRRLVDSRNLSGPLHVCYIHHPPRNLYGYATGSMLRKWYPIRVYTSIVNFFLRHYDFETAQKVDFFIANSNETARRVWKFYRRRSTIVYPPVEVPVSKNQTAKYVQPITENSRRYYLSVGRLTYAKRIDLVIQACNILQLPLKIVGVGREEGFLMDIAGPTIEFMGSVSDETLHTLYTNAKALLYCALDEDFGMVPVEAMAYGTPVISLAQGGVLETVINGKTGILFMRPDADDLVKAIKYFNNIYYRIDWKKKCYQQAEKFRKEMFQKKLKAFVKHAYQERSSSQQL